MSGAKGGGYGYPPRARWSYPARAIGMIFLSVLPSFPKTEILV